MEIWLNSKWGNSHEETDISDTVTGLLLVALTEDEAGAGADGGYKLYGIGSGLAFSARL